MPVTLNEKLLDDKLTELEQRRQWSPRVISKLETTIRTGDDVSLFRINPIRYANEKGIAESEAIDLFLYATKVGLFEMEWHLICMSCGRMVENLTGMGRLHSHFTCDNCSLVNHASLDDYIMVTYSILPQIREIAYHHPAQKLSVEDFQYHYAMSQEIAPLADGRSYDEYLRAGTPLLAYLEPGETRHAEFDVLPHSLVFGADLLNDISFVYIAGEKPGASPLEITLNFTNEGVRSSEPAFDPFRMEAGPSVFEFRAAAMIPPGKVIYDVTNKLDRRASIWLFVVRATGDPPVLQFVPYLSGKKLLTTQTFRDLFRSEVIESNEGISVRDITVMFTDLKGSTEMYDRVGDPQAFYLVHQHFETLGNVVRQFEGATIKTIGDAVMATFMTPLDAVKAALEMLADIEKFNRTISEELILKVGIHRGHSILVTLNDKLDYFGQTVNIASRVQGLAGPGEIYVTDAVYQFPGVKNLLDGKTSITTEQAALKGVSEKMQVHKVVAET